jgi:hypothetical protein
MSGVKPKGMSFLKTATFLLCISLATACSKRTHIQKSESNKAEGLTGTWLWLRTDGGLGNHIHDTPATTGNNIDITFGSDSTYAIRKNGTLTESGTYSVKPKTCIHDKTEKPLIQFSSGTGLMIELLDSGNLSLSDEAFDGVGRLYKRRQTGSR